MHKPTSGNFPPYFQKYFDKVSENNILDALQNSLKSHTEYYNSIPESKGDYAYAEGKWSIKEVLCHIIDTERIMAYRALRFSRGDNQALPGFDQDLYIQHADAGKRSLASLIEEYKLVRAATIALYQSYSPEQLDREGHANAYTATARGLGFMMAGHDLHHVSVLKERYL